MDKVYSIENNGQKVIKITEQKNEKWAKKDKEKRIIECFYKTNNCKN